MIRKNGLFSEFLKQKRKETNLTQRDLALKAGVGLRFIRDIEQGKQTLRLDRLNVVLSLFGYCVGPIREIKEHEHGPIG